MSNLYLYILVMSVVTYLVRMLPLVLMRREIHNRFIRSFLYYVPYDCLAAMTVPAIFFATDHLISAALGFACALFLAYKEQSLIRVALGACIVVFLAERVLVFVGML